MYHRTEIIFESAEYNAKHLQKSITYFLARTLRKMPDWKLIEMCRGISGLEKLTNANWSVSSVNDRLFPVELREVADWKSMSKYSRFSLSRNRRDPPKHFEISVLRHISL